MAFYMQNAANAWPRNGTAPTRDAYPLSETTYGPAGIPPANENPAGTSAYGGYRAVPLLVHVQPSFGEHDALEGDMMRVAQADLYFQPPIPWTGGGFRSGVWDEPGAGIAAGGIARLQPTTSAHPGLNLATGAGPTMVFVAPPVFSMQSQPIYANGL